MKKQFRVMDESIVVGKTDDESIIPMMIKTFIRATAGHCNMSVEEITNGEYHKADRFCDMVDRYMTEYKWA